MSGRGTVRPVRTEGGMHDDYREAHPAYATIAASRVGSHPGRHLFGSEFRHGDYIEVTIRQADLSRGLNADHVFGSTQLVSVALSYHQWATFISTMNVGTGVPCTLDHEHTMGYLPYIEPVEDRRAQFNDEVQADLGGAVAHLREALAQAKTRAQREPIERAIMALTDALPFATKRFDEHAEETLEKVKIEADAWLTSAVYGAGLAALGAGPRLELARPPMKEARDGDADDD